MGRPQAAQNPAVSPLLSPANLHLHPGPSGCQAPPSPTLPSPTPSRALRAGGRRLQGDGACAGALVPLGDGGRGYTVDVLQVPDGGLEFVTSAGPVGGQGGSPGGQGRMQAGVG